ncbi:putative uncharacterized protein C8orf44 [Plecturocebus cupreus]
MVACTCSPRRRRLQRAEIAPLHSQPGTKPFKKLHYSIFSVPFDKTFWESKMGRPLEARSSRPAWPTWQNPVSIKNTKNSQAWWYAPIIPATQEAEARESLEPRKQRLHTLGGRGSRGQEIKTILTNMVRNAVSTKNTKISWAWWHAPVVPATQLAETGELLEPRRPGESRQRSHTGRQRDSFGRRGSSQGRVYGTDGLGWSHPHKENSNWKR